MKSVSRKLALAVLVTLGAAACGDKVTVPAATTTTPRVHSVTVSPSSATVAQGSSFTFGASVDADATLARTVTWSAAGGTGITVDANGVAAASATATGIASICATSTADTGVKGCASLTVAGAAAAATVQIDAITVGCTPLNAALPGAAGCGLQVPVQTNNVGGQVDVAVIVTRPPNSGVTGVKVDVLGGATFTTVEATYSQSLTGDFIAQSDMAAQTTNQTNRIVFSIQTAAYSIGTGSVITVKHVNGQKKLRASLVGGTQTGQAETQLSFRNANGWHVAVSTNLATGANANTTCGATASTACNVRSTSPTTGLAWNGGTPLQIVASAVNFTGFGAFAQPGVGTGVAFGSALCDQSGIGVRASSTAATTIATGNVITGTLAYTNGAVAAAGTLNGYSIAPGGACGAAGEIPTAIAVDATGANFLNFALGGAFVGNVYNNVVTPLDPTLATAPAIRMDNAGPTSIAGYATGRNRLGADRCFGVWLNGVAALDGNGAACPAPVAGNLIAGVSNNSTAQAAFVAGRVARQNGWINGNVNFGALSATAAAQAAVTTAGDANGAISPSATVSGLPADAFGIGAGVTFVARAGACATVTACAALAPRTTATGLAETANGYTLGAIVQTVDVFGNVTNPPTGVIGDNFLLVPNPLDPANPYVANGVLFLGFDNTIPTIVVNGAAGTAATTGSIQAASNVNWTMSADDQATALPAIASGILSSPGNELYVNVTRRDGASTQAYCPVGPQFQPTANACGTLVGWATGTQVFNQNAAAAIVSDVGAANIGYHLASVFTRDQAGNQSAATTRDFIFDNTGPSAFGPSFSPGVLPALGTVTFTGNAVEDLDVGRAVFTVRYPLLAGTHASAPTVIRLPWANKATGAANPVGYLAAGPSALSLTLSQTFVSPRSVEAVTAANVIPGATTQAAAAPNLFEYLAQSVSRVNTGVSFVSTNIGFGQTGLSGATVANPGALAYWAFQQSLPGQFTNMTWLVPNTANVNPIKASGNAGNNQVNSKTITAVATGVGPIQAPFGGGVKFYVIDPAQNAAIGGGTAGIALVEVCTAGSPLNDQATNSWTYSCTYNPSTLLQAHDLFGYNFANSANLNAAAANGGFPAANTTLFPVLAIGFSVTGEGLATQANVNAASYNVIRP